MQVIDAYWEKRNLNCETYEIKIEKTDLINIDKIISDIENNPNLKNSYVVIKTPIANLKLIHKLEENGFRFMETQFEMQKKIKNYETPTLLKRLNSQISTKIETKEKENWLKFTQKMSNDMYSTDRIYLDPKLPKETSKKRYENWIIDLLENPNSQLQAYYKDDIPIGFGVAILENNTKTVKDLLKGVFKEYQDNGWGYLIFDSSCKKFQELGYEKIITHISSNNMPIIKLYQTFDYKITEETYVLRRYI